MPVVVLNQLTRRRRRSVDSRTAGPTAAIFVGSRAAFGGLVEAAPKGARAAANTIDSTVVVTACTGKTPSMMPKRRGTPPQRTARLRQGGGGWGKIRPGSAKAVARGAEKQWGMALGEHGAGSGACAENDLAIVNTIGGSARQPGGRGPGHAGGGGSEDEK